MPQNELFLKITQDLQKAMKEKDELRLSTLRMVKSKLLYVNARGEFSDSDAIKIVSKYAKELIESIEEAKKVGRSDISDKSQKELVIVKEYLPKELSQDEIKSEVLSAIKEIGASTVKDMGNVMKAVMAKHPGIEGKLVNQFAREVLK